VLPKCFLEEAQSGFFVTVRREQEVDGLAGLVDGRRRGKGITTGL